MLDEIINVLYTDRKGESKVIQMKLRQFVMASKVRPQQFKAGDKEAENLLKQIPLEKVPRGTSEEDIKKFEAIKGTVKNSRKKTDVFEDVFKTIKNGKEIEEVKEPEGKKVISFTIEELEAMSHDQIDAIADEIGNSDVKQLKTKKEKAKAIAELLTKNEEIV